MFSKKELAIIGLIAFVLVFGFYWYSLRPYWAHKDCVEYADKFVNSMNVSFEQLYNDCMLRKGTR